MSKPYDRSDLAVQQRRPLWAVVVPRAAVVLTALVIGWMPAVGLPGVQALAQDPFTPPPGFFDDLDYRHVGPVGNRVSAVSGVPGDPNIFYIGAASGGVFKSEDGTNEDGTNDHTDDNQLGSNIPVSVAEE